MSAIPIPHTHAVRASNCLLLPVTPGSQAVSFPPLFTTVMTIIAGAAVRLLLTHASSPTHVNSVSLSLLVSFPPLHPI